MHHHGWPHCRKHVVHIKRICEVHRQPGKLRITAVRQPASAPACSYNCTPFLQQLPAEKVSDKAVRAGDENVHDCQFILSTNLGAASFVTAVSFKILYNSHNIRIRWNY
jgi:hypothetical protein